MRNSIISIVLSLLLFLLSSCGDDFKEDLLYLHVVNNSEIPICVFIYPKEGDVEYDYP